MTRGLSLLALSTVVLCALQISIASPLRVGGVVVMLVWLWPLALALTGSTVMAVGAGALAGLLFDCYTVTPFGLSAVVGALLAYLISRLAREGVGDLDASAWWMPPALIALGGLLAPLIYVIGASLLGQVGYWRASVVTMMIVNATAFFILARPVARYAQRVAELGGWARG